jgi:hypothetical protein
LAFLVYLYLDYNDFYSTLKNTQIHGFSFFMHFPTRLSNWNEFCRKIFFGRIYLLKSYFHISKTFWTFNCLIKLALHFRNGKNYEKLWSENPWKKQNCKNVKGLKLFKKVIINLNTNTYKFLIFSIFNKFFIIRWIFINFANPPLWTGLKRPVNYFLYQFFSGFAMYIVQRKFGMNFSSFKNTHYFDLSFFPESI